MLLLLKRRKRRAPGRGLQPASTLTWEERPIMRIDIARESCPAKPRFRAFHCHWIKVPLRLERTVLPGRKTRIDAGYRLVAPPGDDM